MFLAKFQYKYPSQALFLKKAQLTTLSFIRSRKFFIVVVGLLIIQAAWMALTTRYPMAFDENFHFGVIKIYAHQWSLLITTTPPDSGVYGDLLRNPSYLYYYLFSFPYRLIALFIHQEAVQIVILRFLNIGLFTAGLFAFRKLLLDLRFSTFVVNISLLMLVLIPVVPFLAGQINYDNLLFLLVPIAMILTLHCGQAIIRTNVIPLDTFAYLLIVCLLASIVKYAFLPIFFALLICLFVLLIRSKDKRRLLRHTVATFQAIGIWLKIGLVISLIVAGGLFLERYAMNIVGYGSLEPDCAKLHSIEHCKQNGPWGRNYRTILSNESAASQAPLDPALPLFLPYWIDGMVNRLYFVINYDYTNHPGPPIPIAVSFVIGITGIVLCFIFRRSLLTAHPYFFIAIVVIGVYVASLLYVNFSGYLRTKTMSAINGRYLILILPLLFAGIASSYAIFINKVFQSYTSLYKLGLTVIVCVLVLQGGGILTHVVHGDDSWYWQNQTIINIGRGFRETIKPFIIGAGRT